MAVDSGLIPNMTFFAVSGNMNEYRERGTGMQQPFGSRLPDTRGYNPDGQTDSGPFVLFEESGSSSAPSNVGQ